MRQSLRYVACIALLCIGLPASSLAQVPTSLPVVPTREKESIERIEAALAKRVVWEFVDKPLHELISDEAVRAGIPIVLTKKIEDAGVARDTKVTMQVKDVSFESALNRLLVDLNLVLQVKGEMVLISTVEDAQSPENLVTRVYPVADLVMASDGTYDLDPLKDLICGSIEPDSWGDFSGPAPIYSFDKSPALVISQRREIHQRIEALLVTLRKVQELQKIEPTPKKPAATPLPVLPVPFETPAEKK